MRLKDMVKDSGCRMAEALDEEESTMNNLNERLQRMDSTGTARMDSTGTASKVITSKR